MLWFTAKHVSSGPTLLPTELLLPFSSEPPELITAAMLSLSTNVMEATRFSTTTEALTHISPVLSISQVPLETVVHPEMKPVQSTVTLPTFQPSSTQPLAQISLSRLVSSPTQLGSTIPLSPMQITPLPASLMSVTI